MERKKETIGRFILIECLGGDIKNKKNLDDHTYKAYRDNGKKFQTWCREQGIGKKEVFQDPAAVVQKYTDELIQKKLSPSTIHAYLVPVCKAFKVDLQAINKPKRTAGHINKSRGGHNKQGQQETKQERFKRLVDFQKAVGIRRSELAALNYNDLQKDESGYLCVHVAQGKGGKEQYQRILPQHIELVQAVFIPDGEKKNADKVFSPEELNNKIDLHGMRAEVAREAYAYYLQRLEADPDYQKELFDQLLNRCLAANLNVKGQYKFIANLDKCLNNTQYVLRGENKQRALKQGKPVSYNRMALMAVNVFHLSHWRLDVGVKNYLL